MVSILSEMWGWKTPKGVSLFDREGGFIGSFKTQVELAKYIGVDRRRINRFATSGKVLEDKWIIRFTDQKNGK